jgi:putrescine transport system ATP-binding protein
MSYELAPWETPGNKPLIRFEGVTKRFGDTVALDQLDLQIFEREFFALLGPSGCGKSTLLRMIAGFERPDEGSVFLGDDDMRRVPPYRRPVNMMFQSYALFPHLSVASNIAFGLRQGWMSRGEIKSRVEEMMALVKLEGLGGRKPHQLSGGQRQRVALARSLAKRPKVLLLDEPMAALDKKLRAETQYELMNIQAKLGTTFIIVTHDQQEAMTVAQRIGVMDRGKLMQVARPAELYEQPNSRWVAEFIGDVNIMEGQIIALEPGAMVFVDGTGHRFRLTPNSEAWPGTQAWVALRPEKIRIAKAKPAGEADNCVTGRVREIGYLGERLIYRVKLDNGADMKASVTNETRVTDMPIARDDQVWLTWPRDAGVILTH